MKNRELIASFIFLLGLPAASLRAAAPQIPSSPNMRSEEEMELFLDEHLREQAQGVIEKKGKNPGLSPEEEETVRKAIKESIQETFKKFEKKNPDKAEEGFSEEDFKKRLDEVLKIIRENTAERLDREKMEKLFYGALKGMAKEVDLHSAYYDPEEMKEFENEQDGDYSYGGIGSRVEKDPGEPLKVLGVLRGTPADAAGIRAGDMILKIGEKDTLRMTLEEGVKALQGPVGTEIILTVGRPGKGEIPQMRVVKVTRQEIHPIWILRKMPAPGIGYIYFTEFKSRAAETIAVWVKEMLEYHQMRTLILDLRFNPGGAVNEAAELCGLFLKKGSPIVEIRQRKEGRDVKNTLRSESGKWTELPIVILVNEESASASEIVAGALQDHKRAIVVGSKTYGKGSAQKNFEFDSGKTGLHLTVAKYYLPSGRTVEKNPQTGERGIIPDVKVEISQEARDAISEQIELELEDYPPLNPVKDEALEKATLLLLQRPGK